MNPSFNTAHSTPSTTRKAPAPGRRYGGFSTISDTLGVPRKPLKAPAPRKDDFNMGVPSSATSTVPTPKATFTGGGAASGTGLGAIQMGVEMPQMPASPTSPTSPTTRNVTPPKDYYEKSRTAMDDYMRSLSPSDAENDVTRRRDNLYESTRSGVNRQEESAIPMNFITGRQRVIEDRGREAVAPLESELARLTTQRTALSAGKKERATFEKNLGDEMKADDRYAQGTLQTLGNDVVRLRPDGSQEVVYKGTPEVKTQIVQSGGKNVLINSATGAVMADLGATEGELGRANTNANRKSAVNTDVEDDNKSLYGILDKQFGLADMEIGVKGRLLKTIEQATDAGISLTLADLISQYPELRGESAEPAKKGFFSRLFN